jgi:hypothetical protein
MGGLRTEAPKGGGGQPVVNPRITGRAATVLKSQKGGPRRALGPRVTANARRARRGGVKASVGASRPGVTVPRVIKETRFRRKESSRQSIPGKC